MFFRSEVSCWSRMLIEPWCLFFFRVICLFVAIFFVIWYDGHHLLYSVVLCLSLRSKSSDSTGAMV